MGNLARNGRWRSNNPGSRFGEPVYNGVSAHSAMHNNQTLAKETQRLMNNE